MSIMEIRSKNNFIIIILLFLVSCSTSEVTISSDTNTFNPIPTSTVQKNINTSDNSENKLSTLSPKTKIITTPTPIKADIKPLNEDYPLLIKSWGVPNYFKEERFQPITNIYEKESNTLNLEKLVNQINNTQVNTPGSEYLIPNKSCNIKENEKFLVVDISEYIVRPIIAKQISTRNIGDNRYCTYIENQYVKDVNISTFQIWLERFYSEIHPFIHNIFSNPKTDANTYIVITNLNSGIAGYYSDSNNYPIDIHYRSNDINIVFIDIDQIKNGEDDFLSTLTHEVVHLYQSRIDSYSNSWIKEGTAELITNSAGFEKNLDSNIFSKPISLSNLNIPNLRQYDYFTLFFLYLEDRFNPIDFSNLLHYNNKSIEGISDYLKTNHNYESKSHTLFKEWGLEILNCIIKECAFYKNFITTTSINEINESKSIEMLPLSLQFYKIMEGSNLDVHIDTDINNINNEIWWSGTGDLINNTITFEFEINEISDYTLYFDTYYDIEDRFDLTYLQISKDEGNTWEILSTNNMNSQNSSFYALGNHYTDKVEDWINQEIFLGNLPRIEKLLVRFQYITDDSVSNKGFFVKELLVRDKGSNTINPNKIYLEGFKNHSDLILPSCYLNIIEDDNESGLTIKDTKLIDYTEVIKYTFKKDEQVYIMLQCNDFEGEYSTSINLEYTV